MIRYDLSVLIGQENTDTDLLVKRHDTGISLAVHLVTCRRTSPWREEKTPYIIPEGSKALFQVNKADKTSVKTDVGVSIEGKSTVICEGIVQAFTAAGTCNAEIVLYDPDGKRLTSATFSYKVTPECVCDTDTPSADYIDILSAEIKDVKDAAQTAKEAADKAIGLCANPPKLSENYTWVVWDEDAERYVDTGISGLGVEGPQGPPGEQGPQGIPGKKGDPGFITGSGAPTTETVGEIGQLYMDTDTGDLYKCTAVADGVYTWVKVEGGGTADYIVYVQKGDVWTALPYDVAAVTAVLNNGGTVRCRVIDSDAELTTSTFHEYVLATSFIDDGYIVFTRYNENVSIDTLYVYASGKLSRNTILLSIDETLSIAGQAADAKVVGDTIGNISTALDHIIALQEALIGS